MVTTTKNIAVAAFVIALCQAPIAAKADTGRIYSAEELIGVLTDKRPAPKETEADPDAEFTRGIGGIREGATFTEPSSPGSSRDMATQRFHDLFEADSYNLKARSYRQLDEIGRALHAIIADNPSAGFTIQGHTDNASGGQNNVAFSRHMALAVKNYLVGKLMVDERRIEVVGYGGQKPVASNDSEQGRMANTRIELVGK